MHTDVKYPALLLIKIMVICNVMENVN